MRAQCADTVLMVRPAAFGANAETAATNAFQDRSAYDAAAVRDAARREFESVASRLGDAGVEVILVEDSPDRATPDAVFPNNWVSFHHDGVVVLYPMLSPLRRRERRAEVIDAVRASGRSVRRIVEYTRWEGEDRFLEGTGSLVLDHMARVAYACESPRTHRDPLEEWCRDLDYAPHVFLAVGPDGAPLYHTNVMMCIGQDFAVACLEAVPDPAARRALAARLLATGRDLIEITVAQMGAFAGNVLALATGSGEGVIALSESARGALVPAQRRRLERHGTVVSVPIPTIERHGGGSVRCMLAEVFLPRREGSEADGSL
jgi:hypothetical protein